MSKRIDLVCGGVRVSITGDTDSEALTLQARSLYDAGHARCRYQPWDELGAAMIDVADHIGIYIYRPTAREALAVGVGGLDSLEQQGRDPEAEVDLVEEVPIHVGRSLLVGWKADADQEAELDQALDEEGR